MNTPGYQPEEPINTPPPDISDIKTMYMVNGKLFSDIDRCHEYISNSNKYYAVYMNSEGIHKKEIRSERDISTTRVLHDGWFDYIGQYDFLFISKDQYECMELTNYVIEHTDWLLEKAYTYRQYIENFIYQQQMEIN